MNLITLLLKSTQNSPYKFSLFLIFIPQAGPGQSLIETVFDPAIFASIQSKPITNPYRKIAFSESKITTVFLMFRILFVINTTKYISSAVSLIY